MEAAIEERLPKDVKSLAGPTSAALRQAAPELVDRALEQPALQRLWTDAVEKSHATLVKVLEGDGDVVSTQGGVVVLDLRDIVLEAADRLGIRSQVEDRLPADAGRIEVLQSDELDNAQNVFQLLKTLAWVLPLVTLLAFAGAVWLAHDRRRALNGVGVTIALVGVVGLLAARLTGNYVVDSLVEQRDSRPAADNAWDILTDLMRSSFRWLVFVGILFVVAAWLAGPGRRALASRRALAPALQRRTWAYVVLALFMLVLLLHEPDDRLRPASRARSPPRARRGVDRGDACTDHEGVPRAPPDRRSSTTPARRSKAGGRHGELMRQHRPPRRPLPRTSQGGWRASPTCMPEAS